MQHTNRLAQESSPYLLQHAHNPVDWYPWGEEAFEKAKKEDKPVMVSIGYAACHWCHVMERESFEDEATAAIMNENFINIKVDREERPDVDHIYMDAVQAISGSGGWPLNVFLTPDGKPFYGGTYFPPQRAFNRPSWTEVLLAIAQSYKEGREKVTKDAEALTQHLQQSNVFAAAGGREGLFNINKIHEAYVAVMNTADKEWGGFGRAPKFPQTFAISFLLQYAHITGNKEAREQALLSLDKMMQGGIYDHAGGGFARYATDTEWLAPHFEKMLYDNALLVQTYAEAYQFTGLEKYKTVMEETIAFLQRELLHPEGGFYAALDADSEGEEGRFYVWTFEKVAALLGKDAPLFCKYYNITPGGNWEGKNILFVPAPMEAFAQQEGVSMDFLKSLLANGRQKLLQERSLRIRPQLDDKILLGWNALMSTALCRAYAATGHEDFKNLAIRNIHFLLQNFEAGDNLLFHTWKNGVARYPAFLDDYSYLIQALLALAEVTGDSSWLQKAKTYMQTVMDGFSDEASALFFFTHNTQKDALIRKKEIYDGATPSGNAIIALNLYKLSILYDLPQWKQKAETMVASLGEVIIKYPTSFGVWLHLLYEIINGTSEVAIVGDEWNILLPQVLKLYLPHKIIMAAAASNKNFPILMDKFFAGKTHIYLCKNYACQQPVNTLDAFKSLIRPNN